MSVIGDKILALTKQLYPEGRAFKMQEGGFLEKLHQALSISEAQAYADAMSIRYDILPDNSNFTVDDATDWERRLGLINGSGSSLSDRMLAIKTKMNQPGDNPAKGSYLYLEEQLRNSGFDVYVYENKFLQYPSGVFATETPEQLTGLSNFITANEFNDCQFGQRRFGGNYNNKIVNNISEAADLNFNFDGAWKNTFFIGGNLLGSLGSVPTIRKDQFRQLILKTKPVHTVGFLLINYT